MESQERGGVNGEEQSRAFFFFLPQYPKLLLFSPPHLPFPADS